MKPDYESERVKLYCADCLDVLPTLEAGSIDLTVTSPPYDNLRKYNGYDFNFEGIARELYRVTKPGGVVVWVVGDETRDGSESGNSFRQALGFLSVGFNLHDTMIYEKNGSTYPDETRYYQVFEFMFVLSNGSPAKFNPIKDRKNTWLGPWGQKTGRDKNNALKESKTYYKSHEYGVRFNIWRINGGKGFSTKDDCAYEHPAIFPEKLAADHIVSWSNPSDVILDPMMGSGTTGKMAIKLGRSFIGVDCSHEYYDIALRRIQQSEAQPALLQV